MKFKTYNKKWPIVRMRKKSDEDHPVFGIIARPEPGSQYPPGRLMVLRRGEIIVRGGDMMTRGPNVQVFGVPDASGYLEISIGSGPGCELIWCYIDGSISDGEEGYGRAIMQVNR